MILLRFHRYAVAVYLKGRILPFTGRCRIFGEIARFRSIFSEISDRSGSFDYLGLDAAVSILPGFEAGTLSNPYYERRKDFRGSFGEFEVLELMEYPVAIYPEQFAYF